ncbi:MAG: hydantoinase B/oxoprolinase family protein [Alphaproteobacteria bacterium]|nr:hydantoinase B/oxoprolinase family protein [Alphaproteobacteria bacterium]
MAGETWDFWIDRGGTFTDVVARRADGHLETRKLLSENPGLYADAAIEAMRRVLNVAPGLALPASRIGAIKMGTTVATNALLERKGEPVLLVTTEGFADQLRIGTQNRPKLFVRNIVLPSPLYAKAIAVEERITAHGEILTPLNAIDARAQLSLAHAEGLRACAIVLMHGYRYPEHELRLAEIARELGFSQISLSHRVSPLMKYVPRAGTTVADAYLTPVLKRYVARIEAAGDGPLPIRFMQSNGGLTGTAHLSGKDAILSGPAAGVVGVVETAKAAGFTRIIGFDMGGTSTDVSHCDGAYERQEETEVGGVRLRVPMMAIHTVAAGGGSILTHDGMRMRAGPESAGADPGPAAYGKGGPLTVTDANLLTGRLAPDFFPRIFGPRQDEGLDEGIVSAKFAELSAEIGKSPEDVAEGFLSIAVDNMAEAIKRISLARGYDVTQYVLSTFGGAGGQLACRVADALAIPAILIHPMSGVLSAWGMGLASARRQAHEAIERPLGDELRANLDEASGRLRERVIVEVASEDVAPQDIETTATLFVRYAGTDTSLPVPDGPIKAVADAFREAHRQRFGFLNDAGKLIVESLTVEAIGRSATPPRMAAAPLRSDGSALRPARPHRLYTNGAWAEGAIYLRAQMCAGDRIEGPALIAEENGTIIVEEGWRAEMRADANLLLSRARALPPRRIEGTDADPVLLEIFNNRFMSIAEQMGATLEKTASSVNIKERLDFSCAIYDGEGNLIANAPHMPVHLGSMGASVEAIRKAHKVMADGDAYVVNAPYGGGTHLPDITVVTPVFIGAGAPLFFVAARGHHADVGGVTPGSMPPFSRTLDEEGIVLDAIPLVAQGEFLEADLRARLASGPYPSRNPGQNIADLKAQVAACRKGAQELSRMVGEFTKPVVTAYMRHVQDNAEEAVRRVVTVLKDSSFETRMDGGACIKVRVSVDRLNRTARIDFSGTSAQLPNNFNAPLPVTTAAVLYVFRCLVDSDMPLNAGCLKPLTIVAPEGSMLNPRYPAAVVAGNVETSQAITDALFAALGQMAAAQGTMNNLTFGNDRFQYYETICGGAGAGPGFDGQSAVHTHMTNSRLTDPEVLEWRFPVLVEEFAIRQGSGGKGRFRGGDGVRRLIRFREAMTMSILSTRRETHPFGLMGGGDGKAGRNTLILADGTRVELSGCDQREVPAGAAILIETPGGGGFGAPKDAGEPDL